MELKPEAVDLAALLTETTGSVQAQVQKRRHAMVVSPTPPGLRVQADRGRVRQVLLNLLSNAIKFTPDGGRITVAAGPVNGGSEVRIAVTDTGIGIAADDQPKLFQEFSQLDASASRKYEGTGLGLALSRRLIELHGGAIGVEKRDGKRQYVLVHSAAGTVSVAIIVIVEDQPDNLKLLTTLLTIKGHHVVGLPNGGPIDRRRTDASANPRPRVARYSAAGSRWIRTARGAQKAAERS